MFRAFRHSEPQPREFQLPKVDPTMQILHPFAGSVQQYLGQLTDPGHFAPLNVRNAKPKIR